MFVCFCADHGSNQQEGDDEGGEVTAKQPKKKRPPKRTVEQNLSNINSADSERKCEVCSVTLIQMAPTLIPKMDNGCENESKKLKLMILLFVFFVR